MATKNGVRALASLEVPPGWEWISDDSPGWLKKTPAGQTLTVDSYLTGFRAYVRPRPGAAGEGIQQFRSPEEAFRYAEDLAKEMEPMDELRRLKNSLMPPG